MFKRYSRTLGRLIKLGATRKWRLTYRGEVEIPWEGKTVGPSAWMNIEQTRILMIFTDETGCDIALIENDENAPYSKVAEYMSDFGHNPDQLIEASRVNFTKPASYINPDEAGGVENPGMQAYLDSGEYAIDAVYVDIEGFEMGSGGGAANDDDYILTLSAAPSIYVEKYNLFPDQLTSDLVAAVRTTVICNAPYQTMVKIYFDFGDFSMGSSSIIVMGCGVEQEHKGPWRIFDNLKEGDAGWSDSMLTVSSALFPGGGGSGDITVSEIGLEYLYKK